MANLEVQIGADKSEFDKKVKEVEFDIKELSKEKAIQIKAGLDTTEITKNIKDAKKSLADLKTTLKDTGAGFQGMTKPVANAGHTLTNFSRIAQDAPFGIMGIGNNITATAEAFGHLSSSTGGAGNALKAVGASMLGPGGVIFAISLLTTGLTMMSQKGLTVSDVFNKLTGTFDEFSQGLKEVNKEVAKNTAEEIFNVKALVSAAADENLSRQKRLTAVRKLQDEYPAYFANLTKEQILNGNVGKAVDNVAKSLIAKAKAQALAGKLGDLALKEFELREKEAKLIQKVNKYVLEYRKAQDESRVAAGQFDSAVANAAVPVKALKERLAELQEELRAVFKDRDRIASMGTVEVKASLDLDFEKVKIKKIKKIKELHVPVEKLAFDGTRELAMPPAFDIEAELAKQYSSVRFDPFASLNERMEASRASFINRLQHMATDTKTVLFSWNDALSAGLSSIGDAIGGALVNGGNVLQSVGSSLLSSLGSLLSQLGDKLIMLGTVAVLSGTLLATMFTPVGVAAGLAAIAVGTALKIGGGIANGIGKKMQGNGSNQISGGNSVASPTSTIAASSGSSGFQNVVFEISGQSLVGVLSNTMNKNVKLGGTPAI